MYFHGAKDTTVESTKNKWGVQDGYKPTNQDNGQHQDIRHGEQMHKKTLGLVVKPREDFQAL